MVLSIFQAALGELNFSITIKSQLKILWDFNSQYSWVKYLFYKDIAQMTFLGMAAMQTVSVYLVCSVLFLRKKRVKTFFTN